jgi:hypothetical protein
MGTNGREWQHMDSYRMSFQWSIRTIGQTVLSAKSPSMAESWRCRDMPGLQKSGSHCQPNKGYERRLARSPRSSAEMGAPLRGRQVDDLPGPRLALVVVDLGRRDRCNPARTASLDSQGLVKVRECPLDGF